MKCSNIIETITIELISISLISSEMGSPILTPFPLITLLYEIIKLSSTLANNEGNIIRLSRPLPNAEKIIMLIRYINATIVSLDRKELFNPEGKVIKSCSPEASNSINPIDDVVIVKIT